MLRRLAIFAGGCTLAAAETICQPRSSGGTHAGAPDDVLDGVGSLLDKGLLGLDEGHDGEQRFMLLETVRNSGLEELRAHDALEEAARAHARYYRDSAKAFGPLLFADTAKSRRSVAEYHNIHEALRWFFHHR